MQEPRVVGPLLHDTFIVQESRVLGCSFVHSLTAATAALAPLPLATGPYPLSPRLPDPPDTDCPSAIRPLNLLLCLLFLFASLLVLILFVSQVVHSAILPPLLFRNINSDDTDVTSTPPTFTRSALLLLISLPLMPPGLPPSIILRLPMALKFLMSTLLVPHLHIALPNTVPSGLTVRILNEIDSLTPTATCHGIHLAQQPLDRRRQH